MTDSTRTHCERALSARFNDYRNLISTPNETLFFGAVDAYVDCLRADGLSPEAMVVAIKGLARSAGAIPLIEQQRRDQSDIVESRIEQIVGRAIRRYFGESEPAKGFSGPRPLK